MTEPSFAGRIQASIRKQAPRGRDSERIGPFLATFNRDTDNPYLNYAIPDDNATASPAEVEALVAAYRARNRNPRLEYIPSIAPLVEPALLAAGFAVETRTPLMVCTDPADVRFVPPDRIEFLAPSSEDEFRGASATQWEAYEERGPMPQRAVDGLRRVVEAGGVVALARDAATHEPAGAGLCTPPQDGLTELTSVGVRASFRRRGIAAAITGWLAREAFARGVTGVFLMAAGEAEARIYARAGFRGESEVLHISLPSA